MIPTDDFTLWLGRRVETLRKEQHLTMFQLSIRSGVAQTTLKRMRHGIGNPKMLTLVRICQALGITLNEFFAEEEGGEPLWHTLG